MAKHELDGFNEWFADVFTVDPHRRAERWGGDKIRLCRFLTHAFTDAHDLIRPLDVKAAEAGLWHLIGAGKTLLYVLCGAHPYGENEPPLPSWEERRACINSTYQLCLEYLVPRGLTAADMWWEEFPRPHPGMAYEKEYYDEVLNVIERLLNHSDSKIRRFGYDALPYWYEPSGRAKRLITLFQSIME